MLRILKSLPFAFEFVAVLTIAFGWFVFASLLGAFHGVTAHYNNLRLFHLAVLELALLAVLLPFLRIRGWTFEKVGLRPTLKDTQIGILLFLAVYAAWIVVFYTTYFVSPPTVRDIVATRVVRGDVSVPVAVAVSLVNAFFEEVFVSGYLMTALKRDKNPWLAINASVALRTLYHLYQGAKGVLTVIPTGLMFGAWYARTGRLWPLIVAHAATDLFALLMIGNGR